MLYFLHKTVLKMMKLLKHMWEMLAEWFNDDGVPDVEMTPLQLAQLNEPGSLEVWE